MAITVISGFANAESMQFAKIGYVNNGKVATWSSSGAQTNYDVTALNSEMTVRRWRSTTNICWIQANYFGSVDVDYIAFAAHNLSGKAISVYVNGEATPVATHTPTSNDPLMILFQKEASVTILKVEIDGDTSEESSAETGELTEIGIVYFGAILEMPVKVQNTHSPANLSRVTTIKPRLSDSGQFLSKTIIKKGYEAKYTFEHIDPDFYRDDFDLFVEAAVTRPFFMAWNQYSYPEDVVFGWVEKDIQPSFMGVLDYMAVSFTMNCQMGIEVYGE